MVERMMKRVCHSLHTSSDGDLTLLWWSLHSDHVHYKTIQRVIKMQWRHDNFILVGVMYSQLEPNTWSLGTDSKEPLLNHYFFVFLLERFCRFLWIMLQMNILAIREHDIINKSEVTFLNTTLNVLLK